MTTLIKIKKSSIKKNPNAGRDTYYQSMPWKGRFETNIPKKKLPKYFKERIDRIEASPEESIYCGDLYEPPDGKVISFVQDMIAKGFKMKLSFKRAVQEIRSLTPESRYLYEYEDTKVKCGNCHAKIPVEEIEEDEFDDTLVEICPKCGFWDTFDYKYEKIEEAMK